MSHLRLPVRSRQPTIQGALPTDSERPGPGAVPGPVVLAEANMPALRCLDTGPSDGPAIGASSWLRVREHLGEHQREVVVDEPVPRQREMHSDCHSCQADPLRPRSRHRNAPPTECMSQETPRPGRWPWLHEKVVYGCLGEHNQRLPIARERTMSPGRGRFFLALRDDLFKSVVGLLRKLLDRIVFCDHGQGLVETPDPEMVQEETSVVHVV